MEAVIYSITTKDGLYIGSTIDYNIRCKNHRTNLKSGKLFLLYENIRKNNGQYKIEIILNLACEDKTELRKIEEEHRILCDANLNEKQAYLSIDDALSKNRNYYQINKASINKKRAEITNCVCGGKQSINNKARHYQSKKHQSYLSSL